MTGIFLKRLHTLPLTLRNIQSWNVTKRGYTLCTQCQINCRTMDVTKIFPGGTRPLLHPCYSKYFNWTGRKYTQGKGILLKLKPVNLFKGPNIRQASSEELQQQRDKTVLIYICAVGVFMVGMAYAGVPLYRMFCQSAGLGGQAIIGEDPSKIAFMTPVKERHIRIRFNADTASSMQWNFRPQQAEVVVLPGETALAFYTAKNPTDKPIIGISTYNVVPFEAGQYFNKIQCFCFEEQRLNPHEQVDMPVFFYIDPEFVTDPKLDKTAVITLSYTFFEAKEGMTLPLPGYQTAKY